MAKILSEDTVCLQLSRLEAAYLLSVTGNICSCGDLNYGIFTTLDDFFNINGHYPPNVIEIKDKRMAAIDDYEEKLIEWLNKEKQ